MIEIFIVTYNRCGILKETFESIAAQSVAGIPVVIFDNGSADETESYCKSIASEYVRIVRFDHNLPGNEIIQQIAELASKEYLVIFHDDDIMHPRYVENALKAIEKWPNLVLLGSVFESFTGQAQEAITEEWLSMPIDMDKDAIHFNRPNELAAFFYAGHQFHFASAVYKTKEYQSVTMDTVSYGKISDRPFILSIAKAGDSLVFTKPMIKYRIHANQDSGDSKTGPFANELSNLQRMYHQLLGTDASTPNGRIFLDNSWRYIVNDHKYLLKKGKTNLSLAGYTRSLLHNDATTIKAVLHGIKKDIFSGIDKGVKKVRNIASRGVKKMLRR